MKLRMICVKHSDGTEEFKVQRMMFFIWFTCLIERGEYLNSAVFKSYDKAFSFMNDFIKQKTAKAKPKEKRIVAYTDDDGIIRTK